MALRSGTLLLVLAVVAVAVPLVTVWSWDRVRGPRPARVAARVGLLITAQLTAVVLSAVAINDYGYFFDSWSDLIGSTPSGAPVAGPPAPAPVHTAHRLLPLSLRHFGAADRTRPLAALLTVPVRRRATLPAAAGRLDVTDWSVRSEWPTRGAVVRMDVAVRSTGATSTAYVYLPPAYFRAWHGPARLPVVEVVANAPDDAYDLVYRTPMPGYLLHAIEKRDAPPYVMVLTDAGVDPQACAGHNAPPGIGFFARSLPSAVTRALRLAPVQYAVFGFGSGGYCADRIALASPHRFARAASILGCYQPVVGRDLSRGGARAAPGSRSDDLLALLRRVRAPVHFLVAPGLARGGPCGSAAAQRFLRAVRPPMSADEVVGYAHERLLFVVWRSLLPRVFGWLGRAAAGAGGR